MRCNFSKETLNVAVIKLPPEQQFQTNHHNSDEDVLIQVSFRNVGSKQKKIK